ncbi:MULTISPECIES: substrate-binding domain-containing protein [Pseudomonas]|uniref:Molybdenum ABC transporter substrate-binding protein n=1 Tax=Pseudomonas putida TaxID=303 RepID=A0A2C5WEK3_PSEPU|nr:MULTISPECIES: substrate-binding domain-containing protein [Pseudomonas]PHH43726.1 molybdenum ABC transporter substrate-binding protein [Pseudomonas putida]POA22961.1 molybdenum ABC transporter substrate-binding protein [Pseudomonas sp. FW305-3-2-15-E-TSA4]POA33167.1 molybdenum ABC transporter substrate-binding protein [Pseudomonas sp. FW305-3-2-15-E-TSA2]QBR31591.1 ABC transporter substrate-binding protein [Pseudomonas sp. S150]UVK86349.1 substrate-binding domain-containing protein [Pseudom
MKKLINLSAIALFAFSALAHAEQLNVMTSGGFTAAYKILGPKFAAATGNTLDTQLGPSMGKAPEAIPNRLARGEHADVVIMVGYALDDLIKQGKVDPASRVELADSRIGLVVREGAPKPDISSVESLKKTLLDAKSVAYSDSASGVYIEKELFNKLGVEDQLKPKAKMVPKVPVGSVVATGDYQLGFQQVSELLPVPGVTFVGKIPESVQSVTRFAAGIPVGAQHPKEAKALLDYLAAPAAQADVQATGLDSVKR